MLREEKQGQKAINYLCINYSAVEASCSQMLGTFYAISAAF